MKTVLLPSYEVLDVDALFDNLREIGWDYNGIHSIVVFGSAAKPLEYMDMLVCEQYRPIWGLGLITRERECVKRLAKKPNDIDVMVIYHGKAVRKETTISHYAKYGILESGGYGSWVDTAYRIANLHLQCVSLESFKRAAFKNDNLYKNLASDGIVVHGENRLIERKSHIKDYLSKREIRFIKTSKFQNKEMLC